jgi:hypothetical protein
MNLVFRRYVTKSPKNLMSYVGMLGDITTIGLLLTYHTLRKDQKAAAIEANAENDMKSKL